jgi:hypothetical protein
MLKIETQDEVTRYRPGETVNGLAAWDFADDPPKWVEVRLFWRTLGKGDEDAFIVATERFDGPAAVDAQLFALAVPEGPFSYVGQLIEVRWGLEAVAHRVRESVQLELTVSADAEPVRR